MKTKSGFFSIETFLAFLMIAFFLLLPQMHGKYSTEGIIKEQKINDLLIVFASENISEKEMVESAELLFGKDKFELGIDDETLEKQKTRYAKFKSKYSKEIIVFHGGKESKIRISIFE